jgi:hypothetical protein
MRPFSSKADRLPPANVAGANVRLIGVASIAIGVLFLTPPSAEGADQSAGRGLNRWAILPSKALPNPEISDLVMLELSKIEGVALVERDQLERITDEQFVQLVAASGGGSRQDIGRILKADALLLLSSDTEAERSVLRVTVCDCNFGARLVVETLPDPAETLEQTAKVVAGIVAAVRQRHCEGIKWLLVLPPVVSRDLRHDFDHLQTSYTRVLENALGSIPGVAVVETEEAPSIRRELDVSGTEIRPRAVPLEVEISYQTSDSEDESTRVLFRVEMRDGQRVVREFDSPALDLAAAGVYLAGSLRDNIARAAKIDSTSLLSAEQQFTVLIERADLFSALGGWEQATGLREAALLLNPDAASHRQRLVTEYTTRMIRCRRHMNGLPSTIPRVPKAELNETMIKLYETWDRQTETMVRQHSHWWGRGLDHLEYLVRNRKISFRDMTFTTADYLRRINYGHVGSWDHRPAVMRFFHNVMPSVKQLDDDNRSSKPDARRRSPSDEWWLIPLTAAHNWAFVYSEGNDCRRYFAFYHHVLDQWVPEDMEPFSTLVYKLDDRVRPQVEFRDAYMEFLRKLSQSKRPLNVIYGRFGLFVQQYRADRKVTPGRLAELNEMTEIFDGLKLDFHGGRKNDRLYGYISSRRNYFAQQLAPQMVKAPHTVRVPDQISPTPSTPPPKRPKLPAGRLRFEPLPLLGWGLVKGWISCGPGLDVGWDHDSIRWMPQPGQWHIPFHDKAWQIDDVRWDGRHLWIANRKEGVWVVAPTGKVVARITQDQGLPPADRGLLLQPLREGRVIAVGGFGKLSRAWCAELTYDDDQPGINVFLRAVHVRPPDQWNLEDRKAHRLDPQSVFEPCWTHLYQPRGDNQTTWLLIGRKVLPPLPPLIVDPRTLAVSVYGDGRPYRLLPGHQGSSGAFFSRDGKLLVAGTEQPMLFEWNTDGKFFEHTNPVGPSPWSDPLGTVVPYKGCVYYAGHQHWSRFDPTSFEEQRLTFGELPPGWEGRRLAVSSHYGLVTHGGSREAGYQVYRVVVPEDSPPTE